MTPAFKAGDYDKGIEDGVTAIIGRLDGKDDPAGGALLAESGAST